MQRRLAALVALALPVVVEAPLEVTGAKPRPRITVAAERENTRVHLRGTAPSGTRIRWSVQPDVSALRDIASPRYALDGWSKPESGVVRARHGRFDVIVEVQWSSPASIDLPLEVSVWPANRTTPIATADVTPPRS